MDIGKEKRRITVEPVKDPVPRREPAPAPERRPQEPQRKPEKVPAGAVVLGLGSNSCLVVPKWRYDAFQRWFTSERT